MTVQYSATQCSSQNIEQIGVLYKWSEYLKTECYTFSYEIFANFVAAALLLSSGGGCDRRGDVVLALRRLDAALLAVLVFLFILIFGFL